MQFTNPPGTSRPDISMGRGSMFREGGVDVNSGGMSYSNAPPASQLNGPNPVSQFNPSPQFIPPQPSAPQSYYQTQPMQQTQLPQRRPEMRGPQNTDIDNILAGLKTKTVDIHSAPQQSVEPENIYMTSTGDDSMISISSLKDLQNVNMPKKSRRKQRSDKNTVSLDI